MTWRLDIVLGADGDVRGTSLPVGAPWPLPDWWRMTGRASKELELPVELIGCSDVDAHIPAERVLESAAVFERLGATVTARLYPGMGHLVNPDELRHGRAIVAAVADAP